MGAIIFQAISIFSKV